jgi:hypothetical protein
MKQRILLLFIVLLIFLENTAFGHYHTTKTPIKGVYVKASNTSGPRFNELLTLVNKTELNAMVIDIKDDDGHLTFIPSKNSPFFSVGKSYITQPKALLKLLKKQGIYPIARIVVFKDNQLASKNPRLSFKTSQGLWKNARGESFTNPFLKKVWKYNIGIAIEAAKLGFKEIQFDYVRFPEKFEAFENKLEYKKVKFSTDQERNRVAAITKFTAYARHKLSPYKVKLSVDTFGNTTIIPEARGIGQNFSEIASHVDVISAMIYPSHWSKLYGIEKPDLQPYRIVKEYARQEKVRLRELKNPPISRPWIQDFTATWLGAGNYQVYGKNEIEEQIKALHSEGINEFLLWNSKNSYTPNVDYTPF